MKQEPVFTFAKWQVKQGHLDVVLKLLAGVADKSKQEEGNILYKVYQSAADADTLLLYEGYTDATAVEVHRNSTYFREVVVDNIIPMLQSREVILVSEISFSPAEN